LGQHDLSQGVSKFIGKVEIERLRETHFDSYLVQMNREQLQAASHWIVYAVFAWCLVVVICLVVVLRKEKGPGVND
jgi:hypothetical protein